MSADCPSLSSQFVDADVRNLTPLCAARGRLGIGIDVPGQPTMRLAITAENARFVMLCLAEYLKSGEGADA